MKKFKLYPRRNQKKIRVLPLLAKIMFWTKKRTLTWKKTLNLLNEQYYSTAIGLGRDI